MVDLENNYILLAEAVVDLARRDYISAYKRYNKYGCKSSLQMMEDTKEFLKHGWITCLLDIEAEEILKLWEDSIHGKGTYVRRKMGNTKPLRGGR